MSESPEKQKKETGDITAQLNKQKKEAPKELVPTVEQLTATLKAASDPNESPKQRQEVINSVDQVASTLKVIDDAKTPGKLRQQLIETVKQVTSTLRISQDPKLSPEKQYTIVVIVRRLASTLDLACSQKTPHDLRGELIVIVKLVTTTLEKSHDPKAPPQLQKQVMSTAGMVGVSLDIIHNAKTPQKNRIELAKTTRQVSRLLLKIGNHDTPQTQQARAQKVLKRDTARMKKQQETAASTQGLPDVPLGQAAKVCTDAIFVAVRDYAIGKSLGTLLPKGWREVGVQDFWRVSHVGKGYLDLLVWLKDGNLADAPFEFGRLITRLSTLVPASRLFGLIGTPALYCLQAAWYLDQQMGIQAGTWLRMALEKKRV